MTSSAAHPLVIAMPEPHSAKADYNGRCVPRYGEALASVGLGLEVIAATATPTEIARIASDCSGILLPGSPADVDPQKYGAEKDAATNPADPARDNLDELLLQDAHNLHKPILAICYGVQILNVWRNGTLVQHLARTPIDHEAGAKVERAHEIEIARGTMLHELAGAERATVNSSHHQSLGRAGDALRVAAVSPADDVVEAVEGTTPEHWVLGVQWHPERTFASDRLSRAIFEAFASAVRAWKPRRVTESVVR
jgi:putative glutamine amidotransferase